MLATLSKFVNIIEPPFFKGDLVQTVTHDLRSEDYPIEYTSLPAEAKDGGRVSISLSSLPAYCRFEILKNQTFKI